MFRRRPRFQGAPLNTDQLAFLVKANQLMSEGKPSDGGPLFVDVADAMQRSNHPRRAADLYLMLPTPLQMGIMSKLRFVTPEWR